MVCRVIHFRVTVATVGLIRPHQKDNAGFLSKEGNRYVNKLNAFKRSERLQAFHAAATEERRKDVREQKRMINEGWEGKEGPDSHTDRRGILILCFHWVVVEARDHTFPLSTSKNSQRTLGALPLPGEESDKRQHCPFIPQMNASSITAAYLRVPYACRRPKIRTPPPCMNCWSTHRSLYSLQKQPRNVSMVARHCTL